MNRLDLQIAAFYFFYFSIIAMHIIFMPKVLEMQHYTPSEIGIIFATAPLVRFMIPFMFLGGVELNKQIFNAALLLMFVSAALFYFVITYFYLVMLINIALGIGLALVLPYIEVIALEKIGKARYGKIRLFGSVGFILISLGVVQFELSSLSATLFLTLSTFLTAIFGYSIAKGETQHKRERLHVKDVKLSTLTSHLSLWLAMLLMQVSFGAYYNFFTIFATDHGISLDMTIYLWSFGVIVEIFMLYFQGPLLKRSLSMLLIFATFMTALRWLVVDIFSSNLVILFISQSIHAISFALFHTVSITFLYQLYQQKKLAQQFFFGICYGFGGFLGALSSGYVYEYMPEYLFMSSAFFALMAMLLFIDSHRRIRLHANI